MNRLTYYRPARARQNFTRSGRRHGRAQNRFLARAAGHSGALRRACSGSAASNPTCARPKLSALLAWAARARPRGLAFDYSGHGEFERRLRRGHDRTLVRGSACGLPRPHRGAANSHRLVHGRLDRAASGSRPRGSGRNGTIAGPDPHRAGRRFHRAYVGGLPADVRRTIETEGKWLRPSDYSPEPYPITRRLIEEGEITCCSAGRSAPMRRCTSCKACRTRMCPGSGRRFLSNTSRVTPPC